MCKDKHQCCQLVISVYYFYWINNIKHHSNTKQAPFFGKYLASPLPPLFISLALSFFYSENYGLELNVSLQNDPIVPSITPFPFPPNHIDPPAPIDVDVLRSVYDGGSDGNYYLVGNITFVCETNHTEGNMYFKYSFGDGDSEPYTSADNITHIYTSAGVYNYSVDAVAIKRDSRAVHAAHSGQISILGRVWPFLFLFFFFFFFFFFGCARFDFIISCSFVQFQSLIFLWKWMKITGLK